MFRHFGSRTPTPAPASPPQPSEVKPAATGDSGSVGAATVKREKKTSQPISIPRPAPASPVLQRPKFAKRLDVSDGKEREQPQLFKQTIFLRKEGTRATVKPIPPAPVAAISAPVPTAPAPAIFMDREKASDPARDSRDHQDDFETIRLGVFHRILKLCGDFRIITAQEASAVIKTTKLPPDGMILNIIASLLNRPIDSIQELLVTPERLYPLPCVVFNKRGKLAQIQELRSRLHRLGIAPLVVHDTLITCLMTHPLDCDIVLALSKNMKCPFRWCHSVICKASDLLEYVA
jgi:hypothetical protein